ncbi:MAG: glycosyltransferase family 4 protein [Anaerolineales bacterium]
MTQIQWAGGTAPAGVGDGPRLLRSLKQVIRAHRPDIIQAGPIQRCALLTALTGFRPLVSMSWGYDLLHDVNRGRAWAWATRYTLQRSAALAGDCNTIRELAIQHGMHPEKIVTFPWGANLQEFTPPNHQSPITNYQNPIRDRRGWDASTFVLLSTRNWAPLYGVEDLARAFVRAARQRPELRLLMLGGGPLSGRIKSIIHRTGLIDRVHFPGLVNQHDLPDYYRAADLYISTSHSDGTSISLLESLASGTPVLLTDIPGNKEWVSNAGKVGWLFRDGDKRDLERALLHAVDNRDRLPTMGQAARKLAEERGDWEKNFPKLLEAWGLAWSR